MWVGCIWWVVAWLMLYVCTSCRGSTPSVPHREDLASGQYELKWFEHPFHTLNYTKYITLGALWYTVKYNPSCGGALRISQRICAAKWTTDSVKQAGQGMSVKWDDISFYQSTIDVTLVMKISHWNDYITAESVALLPLSPSANIRSCSIFHLPLSKMHVTSLMMKMPTVFPFTGSSRG